VCSVNELVKELRFLHDPITLYNIEQATNLLHTALSNRWRILIVADFDADGATSCALAIRALKAFDAEWVSYRVPNRLEHGYGLTPAIVAIAAQDQPDLLITVDSGISSDDGVREAKNLGMRVLITDHHIPNCELPPADVIINPNQVDDVSPSKCLAGVGVIFYVMLALRTHLRKSGWFKDRYEPNMAQFLDLVAIGTVSDMVPLDHQNRILVEQGLKRIRAGRCIPGITALCSIAGKNQKRLVASDIGFYLSPRLNAAGRLESMTQGIECLLCDDQYMVQKLARDLDNINSKRSKITKRMQIQASAYLENLQLNTKKLLFGICLFDQDWHPGVIGIIANRLKDQLHRPVIVFAPGLHGQIKGSGRSIEGVHLHDILSRIASAIPGLIDNFGGHAMAIGMTLDINRLETFKKAFDTEIRRQLKAEDLHSRLWSDGELEPGNFSIEMAILIRDAGPWGQGFPEPMFDGIFEIVSQRVLKERHLKLWLRPEGLKVQLEAIAFNQASNLHFSTGLRVRIAYHLEVDWDEEHRVQRLQLRIRHIETM
jgi:single-stranded-DNA-specific exonuclease